MNVLDEQQQRQINEAAEQFANALKDSYRVIAERSVSAQEINAQLTQDFFSTVVDNHRTQAEDTEEMTQRLADQQQRAQEAGQTLIQQSVDAYIELIDYMCCYYRLLAVTHSKLL